MCTVAAGIAVVGLIMTVKANNDKVKYDTQVAKNNAITAEYQAVDAIERGALEEKQARLDAKQLKGQQTAAIAGSGFTLSDGSAADVLANTAALEEENVYRIRSNAAREAWAYRVGAQNSRNQGAIIRSAGQNRNIASVLEASGTVAQEWYRYSKTTTN